MKENHKIDELFKKGLSDYQSELPSLKTKEKIFGKLSLYQNLKFLYIFIISILLVSSYLWAYQYFLNLKSQKLNSNQLSNNTIIIKNNLSDAKVPNNSIPNNSVPVKKDYIKKDHIIKNKNTTLIIPKYNFTENDVKSNVIKTDILYAEIEVITQKEEENEKKENIYPQQVVLTTDLKENKTKNVTIPETENPLQSESEIIKEKKENKKEKQAKDTKENNDDINKIENLIKDTYKKPFISSFELLLSGNVFYTDKKITADKERESLIRIRKSGEAPILVFSPAIEIRYNFNSFFVQGGFQFQRYGEKSDFQTIENIRNINSQTLFRDTLYYVKDSINPPGEWHLDTIWYLKLDTVYNSKTNIYNRKNTYNYIELPLMIGKRFRYNNFSLEIATGFSLGLMLKANSEILATDSKSSVLITDERSPYLKSLMVNYQLRFYIKYALNENWSVFINPQIKYNLGGLFNENWYPVKQNYMLYGIGTGVIYKL